VSDYVFQDNGDLARRHVEALQAYLDPVTTTQLSTIGVAAGWRCLEVGGGGGSIAGWLSRHVGPSGYVLATDLQPDQLRAGTNGNVTVVRHDIAEDDLPEAEFDLVHARLVLVHVERRHQALAAMVRALKPGGWLLIEEFDPTHVRVLSAPGPSAALFTKVHDSVIDLLAHCGLDHGWGVALYDTLRQHGLDEVTVKIHGESWPGGSPASELHVVNSHLLQDALVAGGRVTVAELESFRALFSDPAFAVSSYLVVSAWGRRRAAERALSRRYQGAGSRVAVGG
jgi:SAM-dependent methyltransferase